MGNIQFDRWKHLKQYYVQQSDDKSYFQRQQNSPISESAVRKSLEFAVNAKKQHYGSIRKIYAWIQPLGIYITQKPEVFAEIEDGIGKNLGKLVQSAVQVLKMQDRFLQKVNPTNISYFHFMRKSDIYMHYIAMKYVLDIGSLQKHENISIFDELHYNETVKMFRNLTNWLYQMINYKCSAIYIKDETVQSLIEVTYLVLCGLLSAETNLIQTIERGERQYIYNQLFYILVYICCRAKDRNIEDSQPLYDVGAVAICRVVCSCDAVNVSLFAPSYWYINLFGLVKSPTVDQILLLLSFEIIQQSLSYGIEVRSLDQPQEITTTVLLFSHMALELVSKYSTSATNIVENYLLSILPNLPSRSISRAFLAEIISILHLEDKRLRDYTKDNRHKGYCIGNDFLSPRLARKNWIECETTFYFQYFSKAIVNKTFAIRQSVLWKEMLSHNRSEIRERNQLQEEEQRDGINGNINSEMSSTHNVAQNTDI